MTHELKEVTVAPASHDVPLKDWRMAIAFRRYQPGDGAMAWAAAKVLGRHDVMHCDIIMNVPCGEKRCGHSGRIRGRVSARQLLRRA